jgi:hypothetical protein
MLQGNYVVSGVHGGKVRILNDGKKLERIPLMTTYKYKQTQLIHIDLTFFTHSFKSILVLNNKKQSTIKPLKRQTHPNLSG